MAEWDADANVDAELAQVLVEPFASLRGASLRPLAEGWDVAAWLVADRYVFRFPRRAAVVAALRREIALLPRLAPLLPAPIPVPLFVGEPRAGFPFPYAGYAILPGAEACDVSLDARERTALALELARFLSALHAVDLDADLPVDATGRADMQRRVPLARVARAARDRRPVARAADVDLQLIWSFSTMPAAPPFSTSTARSATRR